LGIGGIPSESEGGKIPGLPSKVSGGRERKKSCSLWFDRRKGKEKMFIASGIRGRMSKKNKVSYTFSGGGTGLRTRARENWRKVLLFTFIS